MNISWKVVVVALVATFVAGCSPVVSQPPEQPKSPAATPSQAEPSSDISVPPGYTDVWMKWAAPKPDPDNAEEVAQYFELAESRGANKEGFTHILLFPSRNCVALVKVKGEPQWPMMIWVAHRIQPEDSEADIHDKEVSSYEEALDHITDAAKAINAAPEMDETDKC